MRLRSRLFFKIYLALLASLAAVAVAGGIFVHLVEDKRDRDWTGRREAFLTAMLPPGASPRSQDIVLERLAKAFNADIALYGPDGSEIAAAGRPLPRDLALDPPRTRRHWGAGVFAMRLPDGRRVAARFAGPDGPGGRNPLAYLALIAAVIGIAAYPVVRHLTRRLETLRVGVETWGSGALGERVPVRGKDEVAAVAASFNAAAARIERLVEAHRALLANASHELRSPLARLRMAIDLYERQPQEETKQEIVQSLGELDTLVEEILLASRLDHSNKLEARETVDLLALAAEEGARNGIKVTGASAMVTGDPRLLTRLVRNLMHNGLRHGKPPVSGEVASSGNNVELLVCDAGDGVPESERERVFEPFYRPVGRSEAAGGWGLGLSLVRQIAERHGGSVRYEKPKSGGACFVVTLPSA